MSYDLRLVDEHNKGPLSDVIGVSYSYAPHLIDAFEDLSALRVLLNLSSTQSKPLLEKAISRLKDKDADTAYVKSTLQKLLELADKWPDGVWEEE